MGDAAWRDAATGELQTADLEIPLETLHATARHLLADCGSLIRRLAAGLEDELLPVPEVELAVHRAHQRQAQLRAVRDRYLARKKGFEEAAGEFTASGPGERQVPITLLV